MVDTYTTSLHSTLPSSHPKPRRVPAYLSPQACRTPQSPLNPVTLCQRARSITVQPETSYVRCTNLPTPLLTRSPLMSVNQLDGSPSDGRDQLSCKMLSVAHQANFISRHPKVDTKMYCWRADLRRDSYGLYPS